AARRGGARHLLRRLHQHPRSDRLMRVLVIGLGATGDGAGARAMAAHHEVVVFEDQPGGDAYRERARRAVAAGAEVLETPDSALVEARASTVDLVIPSPGVRPDHPAIVAATVAGVPVRSEVDVAVERLRARTPA